MLRKVLFVLLAFCAVFDVIFVQSMAESRSMVTQILLLCIKFGILLAFYVGAPLAKKMFVVGSLGLALYFVMIACGDYPVRLASTIYGRTQTDMSPTMLRCLFIVGAVILITLMCILLFFRQSADEQYTREVWFAENRGRNKKLLSLMSVLAGVVLVLYVIYLMVPRTLEDIARGETREEISGFSISILYEGAYAGYDDYAIRASEASEEVALLLKCLQEQSGYWVPEPETLDIVKDGEDRTGGSMIVSVSIEPWYGGNEGGERRIHIYGNGHVYLDDYTGASMWRDTYRLSEEEIREVFTVVENIIRE